MPTKKELKKKLSFDPDGSGYDFDGAIFAGLEQDENGEWPVRQPDSGLIFVGKKHSDWSKMETESKYYNRKILKKDGRYYSSYKSDMELPTAVTL